MIDAAIITTGLGSVLYGLLRPLAWLLIAWAAWRTPATKGNGGRNLLIAGALVNSVVAGIFLFVNADIGPPLPWLVDFAEIAATPAQAAFAVGYLTASIWIGGLKFGRDVK